MDFYAEFLRLTQEPIFSNVLLSCNIVALVCWITTLVTNNFSQIDRLWSILPVIYGWTFVYFANPVNSGQIRLFFMATLVTLWGIRLTYNFWRKGGYSLHDEDYRWVHVRKMFKYPQYKIPFHLFNLVFIAFIQSWLLMGLVTPIWIVATSKPSSQENLNLFDFIVLIMYVIAFLTEIITDEQQFKFQTRKYQWIGEKKKDENTDGQYTSDELKDFKRGFLTRGLFKYSRHPNIFGELSMWWCIYLFTISSQYPNIIENFEYKKLINWSIIAPGFLNLLLHGSTNLTEKISSGKYAEYKKYQAKVSRIIPWLSSDLN